MISWLMEKLHLGPDYEATKDTARKITDTEREVKATANTREKAMKQWSGLVSAGEVFADLAQGEHRHDRNVPQ